jgi:hypothetical protein
MSETSREGMVHGFDGRAVPIKEIIGRTEKKGRSGISAIEAEGALKPGQSLRGSACPHQNLTPPYKALGAARINLEGTVDLS